MAKGYRFKTKMSFISEATVKADSTEQAVSRVRESMVLRTGKFLIVPIESNTGRFILMTAKMAERVDPAIVIGEDGEIMSVTIGAEETISEETHLNAGKKKKKEKRSDARTDACPDDGDTA